MAETRADQPKTDGGVLAKLIASKIENEAEAEAS